MNLIDERNEILNFQKIAKNIKPDPGEIPEISGLDIYGETIPLSGDVCGDHIIYVDFTKRFNLPERIKRAETAGRIDIVNKLKGLKDKAGIMLSDVSGHSITDHLLNAMLHQAFLVGASYELTMFGEITIDLFETKGETRVLLLQDNNPTESAREHSEQNWNMMLESLKKFIENK